MDDFLKAVIVTAGIVILISGICWLIGGVHLDYLRGMAPERLEDYDFDGCVYDGYNRTVLTNGFGGTVWYLCQKDNIYYEVGFGRTINVAKPLQMYGPEQKTIFPSQFNIEK